MATALMFIVMFGLMFFGVPIAVAMFIGMFVLIGINPVTTGSFLAQPVTAVWPALRTWRCPSS